MTHIQTESETVSEKNSIEVKLKLGLSVDNSAAFEGNGQVFVLLECRISCHNHEKPGTRTDHYWL